MPRYTLTPRTPEQQSLQQENDATQVVNKQASEQDFIAKQQKEAQAQAATIKRAEAQAASAAKAQVANAKRAGVKTAVDEAGNESIQTHEDGAPVYESGFQGEISHTPEGPFASYRDSRGGGYKVPAAAINEVKDAAGASFYEFKTPEGQTVRQPVGTKPLFKTDPTTGKRYTEAADASGSFVQTPVGVDKAVAATAAVERRKAALKAQDEALDAKSKELTLQKQQIDYQLEPIRAKLSEAEAAAKKFETGTQYKQTEKGLVEVNEKLGDVPVNPSDPEAIAKANNWLASRKAAQDALAAAKAEHDPLDKQSYDLKGQHLALGRESFAASQRAAKEIAAIEQAAKAGLDVSDPQWKEHLRAQMQTPLMLKVFNDGHLAERNPELAAAAEEAAFPESNKLLDSLRKFPQPAQPGSGVLSPESKAAGVKAVATPRVPSLLEKIVAGATTPDAVKDAKTTATTALGILNPEKWQVNDNGNGSSALIDDSGTHIGDIDSTNRMIRLFPAPFGPQAAANQQRMANANENGLPIYMMGGEQPMTKVELRDYVEKGLHTAMSATTDEERDAKLAEAGMSPDDIRKNVLAGRISFQEGRMLADTLHGIKQKDITPEAMMADFKKFIASDSPEARMYTGAADSAERMAAANKWVDKWAAGASGNIIIDRAVLEDARAKLVGMSDRRTAIAKAGDVVGPMIKNAIVSMGGMIAGTVGNGLALAQVGITKATGLGGLTSREKQGLDVMLNQTKDVWDRNTKASSIAHRFFGEGEMRGIIDEVHAWARTAGSGDSLPEELDKKLSDAVYDGYFQLQPEAAKELGTTRDSFSINKTPALRGMLNRYLQTGDPSVFEGIKSMLVMTGNDRRTALQAMDYVSRPRVASGSTIMERGEKIGVTIDRPKADQLLALSRVMDNAANKGDAKWLESLTKQAGSILGIKDPAHVMEAMSLMTNEESDDPDSWTGMFRGAYTADAFEQVTELGSDIATGLLAATVVGAPEAGALQAAKVAGKVAKVGAMKALKGKVLRTFTAAGNNLAERSVAFAKFRKGIEEAGSAFKKAGIVTEKVGQPLTLAQKTRNVAVQIGKVGVAGAPIEGVEEAAHSLLDAGPNAAKLVEDSLAGMVGGMSIGASMAGIGTVYNSTVTAGRQRRAFNEMRDEQIRNINREFAGEQGFKPLTVEDYEGWQAIQANPVHNQNVAEVSAAMNEFTKAAILHQMAPSTVLENVNKRLAEIDGAEATKELAAERADLIAKRDELMANPESAIDTTSGPLTAASARFQAARDNMATTSATAFAAMDELRALPANERALYTAAAKAVAGSRTFTEAEAKALIAQSGENAVAFSQATAMPEGVAGPAQVTSTGAPTVTRDIGKRMVIPEGARIIVPPALVNSLAAKAPSMGMLIGASQEAVAGGAATQAKTPQESQQAAQPVVAEDLNRKATANDVKEVVDKIINDTITANPTLAERVRYEPTSSKNFSGLSANTDDATISVDMEKLLKDLMAMVGQGETTLGRLQERMQMALGEEIIHIANVQAAIEQWKQSGDTRSFQEWRDEHYSKIWNDEFTDAMRAKVLETYKELKNAADWLKAFEGLRMLQQLKETGSITEMVKRHVQAVLDFLKTILDSLTPALKQEMEMMQAILDEFRSGKKEVKTPKSSTQFTLSPADAKPVLDFGASIPKHELYDSVDPEWSDGALETDPHVTVLYGLTKHEAEPVAKAIADHGPVTITLGKMSLFESADYDVLKVDIEGEDLRSLNTKLSKLPNENSFPDYKPHMTIAYLKKGEGKKYVGDARFEGKKITFDTMTFSPPSELRGQMGKPELPLVETDLRKMSKAKLKAWAAAQPTPVLPDVPSDYFVTDGAQMVDVSALVPLRPPADQKKSVKAAMSYAKAAADGKMDKRKPISVRDNGDGTFSVLDGNATLGMAQAAGWAQLPVTVLHKNVSPELRAAVDEAALVDADYTHAIDGDWRGDWKVNETGRSVRTKDGKVGEVIALNETSDKMLTVMFPDGSTLKASAKDLMVKLTPDEIELEPHFVRRVAKYTKILDDYNAKMKDIAKGIGEEVAYGITAPLKGAPRALEKAAQALKKERMRFASNQIDKAPSAEEMIASMHDIMRGSILVDSQTQVMGANAAILRAFAPSAALKETRNDGVQSWVTDDGSVTIIIDDRFSKPTPAGYSDVQMKIEVAPGMFAEMQVHIPEMLLAKEGVKGVGEMKIPAKWFESVNIEGFDTTKSGHVLFEEYRAFEKDDRTTPRKLQLEQEMADLYRRAKEAHNLRIAASASSLEMARTKGSSPVSNGTPGTSSLPSGPSTQNLPSSMTDGLPSSEKNLAEGENSSGSGVAFTTDNTTGNKNNQAQDLSPVAKDGLSKLSQKSREKIIPAIFRQSQNHAALNRIIDAAPTEVVDWVGGRVSMAQAMFTEGFPDVLDTVRRFGSANAQAEIDAWMAAINEDAMAAAGDTALNAQSASGAIGTINSSGDPVVVKVSNLAGARHADHREITATGNDDGTRDFRFNADNGTIYWWSPASVTSDEKQKLKDYLEADGFTVTGNKNVRDDFTRAHGALNAQSAISSDVKFKRAKDFPYSGIYEVELPTGTKRAFRDPESGAWLNPDAKTGVYSPLPYEMWGWNKSEALEAIMASDTLNAQSASDPLRIADMQDQFRHLDKVAKENGLENPDELALKKPDVFNRAASEWRQERGALNAQSAVSVTVAPMRRDSLAELTKIELNKRAGSAKFLHLQQVINDVSSAFGVRINQRQPIIGGWTEDGKMSLEVPESIEFDTQDLDLAEDMAAIIAASAPELQNAALVWKDDLNGKDTVVTFTAKNTKSAMEVAKDFERAKVNGFSYDPQTQKFSLVLAGFSTDDIRHVHEYIRHQTESGRIKSGGSVETRSGTARFPSDSDYRRNLESARGRANRLGGERASAIREVVDRAERRINKHEVAKLVSERAQEALKKLKRPKESASAIEHDLAGRQFDSIRQFGLYIDERFKKANGIAMFPIGSKEGIEHASKAFAYDIIDGLSGDGSGMGWYDERVQETIRELTKMHPEFAGDPNALAVYIGALASTSQGYTVTENFKHADAVYKAFKRDGKMPTDMKFAASNALINGNLAQIQTLIDRYGVDGYRQFMDEEITGGALKDQYGIQPAGVTLKDVVRGNRILGAKIGSFFNNLNGRFNTITMDLWYTRTMHRYLGSSVVPIESEQMQTAIKSFRELLKDPTSRTYGINIDEALKSDENTVQAAVLLFSRWARGENEYAKKGYTKFPDGFKIEKSARTLFKIGGMKASPQNKSHREYFADIVKATKYRLAKMGFDLSEADIQAIVWYREKNLFARSGVANSASKPADYLDAVMALRSGKKATDEVGDEDSEDSDALNAQSASESKEIVNSRFAALAKEIGVELRPNIMTPTARYIFSRNLQRERQIEFNPMTFSGWSEKQIVETMREELVHAIEDQVLLEDALKKHHKDSPYIQNGQYNIDFYESVYRLMTPKEIEDTKLAYPSHGNSKYIIGAEFSRMMTSAVYYGKTREQVMFENKPMMTKAMAAIKRLLQRAIGYLERLAKGNSESAQQAKRVHEGALKMLARIDPREGALNAQSAVTTIQGSEVKTGVPITFKFLHNKSSYTRMLKKNGQVYKPSKEDGFDRGYEPSGQYMVASDGALANQFPNDYATGEVTFKNPIVIDAGTYGEENSWKRTLSNAYGGKTGKKLSQAIIASGHDGIITVQDGRDGEIVDLTSFDPSKALYSQSASQPAADHIDPVMRVALESLPPTHRNALERSLKGESPQSIAANMHLSEVAIGNILRMAEGRLAVLLRAKNEGLIPKQSEDDGVRIDGGRPDLAHGAIPQFAAVDQSREGPETVTHAAMQNLARRMFDVDPVAAKNMVTRWMDSGGIVRATDGMPEGIKQILDEAEARLAADMLMTAAAKLLVNREILSGGDPIQVARLIHAYRNTGTEQARSLNMRYDPFLTPEERHVMFITESVLTPPDSIRSEMEANPSNRDRILAKWALRSEALKERLKEQGFDIDLTFKLFHEEQEAREEAIPVEVRQPLAQASVETRQVVKSLLQGDSIEEAATLAGVAVEMVGKLYNAFRDQLNKVGAAAAAKAKADMLSASAAADFASMAGVPFIDFNKVSKTQRGIVSNGKTQNVNRVIAKRKASAAFSLNSPVPVAQIVNQASADKANWFDKMSEYWRSMILSGPMTHVVNSSSGITFGIYDGMLKKAAGATLNSIAQMFGVKNDAATLADLPALFGATKGALAQAYADAIKTWKPEADNFDEFALAINKKNKGRVGGDAFSPAIGGWWGKVVRAPSFRMMMLADVMVKSFFTRIEVASQAHQIARTEGLSGQAMATRIAELMKPGSIAWVRGLAQAKKITFQTNIGDGSSAVDSIDGLAKLLNKAKSGHHGWLAKGVSHFVVPFVNTPTNIFKVGATMSPLGTFLAIIDAGRALNQRRQGNVEEANRLYSASRALDDLVNQTVAWGAVIAISQLIRPDDDDDKLPWITGTMQWKTTSKGERDIAYKVAPPQSIRIGDRWYSYARLDPFATMLASIVDSMTVVNSDKPADEKWGTLAGQMANNLKDKTFLQGLSDLFNAIQDPGRFGPKWAQNIATGFVPNFVRQPLRAIDPNIRDSSTPKDWGFWETMQHRIGASIIPDTAIPAVDLWGNTKTKNTGTGPLTDIPLRLFSPVQSVSVKGADPLDVLLLNYNRMHDDEPFAAIAPDRTIDRTINGVHYRVNLDDSQYNAMLREAGKAIRSTIGNKFDGVKSLAERDVEWIDKLVKTMHGDINDKYFKMNRDKAVLRK